MFCRRVFRRRNAKLCGKKDILYFSADDGAEKGLKPRYDVYYPTLTELDVVCTRLGVLSRYTMLTDDVNNKDNCAKAALINNHGSGDDKNIGNYAHRNKYFACVGITLSGHGSDSLLSGIFNQAYMYYAERFMAILAK